MTDNEIIKAFECCNNGWCDNRCPYYGREDIADCREQSGADQLALINRQKAEIERLEFVAVRDKARHKEVLASSSHTIRVLDDLHRQGIKEIKELEGKLKTAKAEAIKDFAERVYTEIKDAMESNYKAKEERVAKCKEYGIPICPEDGFLMYCDGKNHALSGIDYFIDNLVKEMVGDSNASKT